ncbi:MAG: VWA domain-containing protein [Chloroflexales bacterium]|nr:VWA domain-containing protein [Chloroflexales bacterium]
MDRRITEFIAGLRAAGVRVSLAETADAMRAIEQAGIIDRAIFAVALQASLIKDAKDQETFRELFPLYFGKDAPPPLQQPGGGQLSDDEREQLMRQLQQMLAQMTPQQLAQLFRAMMTGQPMSGQEMRELLDGLPQPHATNQRYREWMTRQALRELDFNKLDKALRELLEQLRQQGMSEQALQAIEQAARENERALAEQIGQQVAQQMAEQARGQGQARPRQRAESELLDRPFDRLDERDADDMRKVVNRLAARLRTRLALRLRRGKTGTLDAKSTIRTNQRFGGVPMQIKHRKRHLKPKLIVFCDRSVSTQHVMTFLLLMVYSLHDQLSRTRSFAFIDHLHDMTMYFAESRPDAAIEQVMQNIKPTRSYSTDLGAALGEFARDHLGCVDHRTTVIFLGDARNNENDPGLAAFDQIRRRARRVVWFATEEQWKWGVYDPGSLSSDIYQYALMCDALHEVTNLRQLADAIDRLFVRA